MFLVETGRRWVRWAQFQGPIDVVAEAARRVVRPHLARASAAPPMKRGTCSILTLRARGDRPRLRKEMAPIMSTNVQNIRNIAFVGHSAAGKTTLIESILANTGKIGRMGSVDEGNTVCDYEIEEKEHHHSLNLSIATSEHKGYQLTLIDTPGYPDFLGQAISAFPAVETVALVMGADKGIQTVHRRMMKLAQERNMPRMIIINKIDDHVSECEGLLSAIRETFGTECMPINLPAEGGSKVVDLWGQSDGDVDFSSVAEGHQQIVDQVVEVDEALMEQYLEQGEVEASKLHPAFEQAMREGHLVPIVFCSARTGVGITELIEVIENHCPNPSEGNPRPFEQVGDDEAEDWHAEADPSKEMVGHIFKVTTDQFVGKLAYVRVHQGTMKSGGSLYLDDAKKAVRIGHLYRVFGKETQEVSEAGPGDIIALAKIDELHYGGILHASHDHAGLRFRAPTMPKPMFGLAVEAKSRNDESKIGQALRKLTDEDPTFTVERVDATGETVARGLGELHMRVVLEKLKNRFRVEVNTHPPKVAYKETITVLAEGHHRHKKQSGGAGQFGEVYLKIEPLPQVEGSNGAAFEFVDETVGGSIPRQFMPAIEKGVRQVLLGGAVAGYPLTGVRVRVYDGKYHPVDSKEVAFVAAGRRAFIDAVQKARPALLEPFVDIEVTAPSECMGDITADIAGKRGQVQNTDYLPGDLCVVYAKAPLAEMSTYSTQLKSMTGGQGSYVMDYSHDEQTPPNVQADIIAAFKPKDEED